jgi:hypothetical protein
LFGTVAGGFDMLSFSRSRVLAVLRGNALVCAILFSSAAGALLTGVALSIGATIS